LYTLKKLKLKLKKKEIEKKCQKDVLPLHTNPFKCWTSSREAVNTNF